MQPALISPGFCPLATATLSVSSPTDGLAYSLDIAQRHRQYASRHGGRPLGDLLKYPYKNGNNVWVKETLNVDEALLTEAKRACGATTDHNNGWHMRARCLLVAALLVPLGCGQTGDPATNASDNAGGAGADATGGAGSAGTAATARVCGDGSNTTINDAEGVAAIVDCTTINGNLLVSNTMLTSLSLPKLVKVDGFFNCQVNPALTSLSLPALTKADFVFITGNDELATLELPNLVTAGLTIFAPKLTSLSLPKLVSADVFDFEVWGAPLTSFSVPNLETVASEFIVKGTSLLTDLALPKLATVGGFSVDGNYALSQLTAPALATANYFRINGNPRLPTCQAQALLQQLTNFTGQTLIAGNDDTGSCQ